KAQALLADHWIDWWCEVCAAVGLPVPAPKPAGPLGRLARRVGFANPPGHPYELSRFAIRPRSGRPYDTQLAGWTRTTFRGGFAESVGVSLPLASMDRNFLRRWPSVAPLAALHATAPYTESWLDGPHLAGVRSLSLKDYDPVVLVGALVALAWLEDLTLFSS